MTVEVLLSTMYQTDLDVIQRCNINSSCLIINQCDRDDYIEKDMAFGKIRMISSIDRGLSVSRNLALNNSKGDICILCDDDIKYISGYDCIIERAFNEISDADVIVFNVNSLNPEIRPQESLFTKKARISRYKTYSSVHIAFRKKSIIDNNIRFDERFGSGSNLYSMGEDSLFFSQIHRARLKAYTYPAVIADLSSETSTWFKGYNQRYFYDVGAFISAAYPKEKHLFKYYYPIRFRRLTTLSAHEILVYINKGINGFVNQVPYNEKE